MRRHAIQDGIDEPKCSRCGQTVYDPELYDCVALSDGEIYKHASLSPLELAATDLLFALKRCRAHIELSAREFEAKHGAQQADIFETRRLLHAAIAKAEGNSP